MPMVDTKFINNRLYWHEPGESFEDRESAKIHAETEKKSKSWLREYRIDKMLGSERFWIWWKQ